jgi:hypothetical protein
MGATDSSCGTLDVVGGDADDDVVAATDEPSRSRMEFEAIVDFRLFDGVEEPGSEETAATGGASMRSSVVCIWVGGNAR